MDSQGENMASTENLAPDVVYLSTSLILGTAGIVSNSILHYVTRNTDNEYPLMQLLAIGDIILCLAHTIASPVRLVYLVSFTDDEFLPAWWCFVHPWIYLFNVGYFWPTILFFGMAFERFIADGLPKWHQSKWDLYDRRYYRFLLIFVDRFCGAISSAFLIIPIPDGLFLFVVIIPGPILVSLKVYDQSAVSIRNFTFSDCCDYGTVGKAYSESYRNAALYTTVIAFVFLFLSARKDTRGDDTFANEQRRKRKMTISITFTSFLLVLLPAVCVEATNNPENRELSRSFEKWFQTSLLVNSVIRLFAYFFVSPTFRSQTRDALRRRKLLSQDHQSESKLESSNQQSGTKTDDSQNLIYTNLRKPKPNDPTIVEAPETSRTAVHTPNDKHEEMLMSPISWPDTRTVSGVNLSVASTSHSRSSPNGDRHEPEHGRHELVRRSSLPKSSSISYRQRVSSAREPSRESGTSEMRERHSSMKSSIKKTGKDSKLVTVAGKVKFELCDMPGSLV